MVRMSVREAQVLQDAQRQKRLLLEPGAECEPEREDEEEEEDEVVPFAVEAPELREESLIWEGQPAGVEEAGLLGLTTGLLTQEMTGVRPLAYMSGRIAL